MHGPVTLKASRKAEYTISDTDFQIACVRQLMNITSMDAAFNVQQ